MRTYKFRCNNCSVEFIVQEDYLVEKDNLVCPNCSCRLPDHTFEKLKTVATTLKEYDKENPWIIEEPTENRFFLTISGADT